MSIKIRTFLAGFFSIFSLLTVASTCEAGPLHDAVKAGDLQEVKRLLDSGSNPNEYLMIDAYTTKLPICLVDFKKDPAIAEEILHELLQHGAKDLPYKRKRFDFFK